MGDVLLFLGLATIIAVVLLWRSRAGGSGGYVPGAERPDPRMLTDEANLRAGQFPGPGGPVSGGGGNAIGGG